MNKNTFDEILSLYIYSPEEFWPNNSLFHKRNRSKIEKARSKLKSLKDGLLLDRLQIHLKNRFEKNNKTLYVISCGSSGCHFLGEILAKIGNFDLVKEVYYPPKLINLCSEKCSMLQKQEKQMLFDMVSYFPSCGLERDDPCTVPINVMHLRGDTPTSFVRKMGNHYLVLLIRNPFDIAYSRSFRKNMYRLEADPNASDGEYLIKQLNNVRRFFNLVSEKENSFDAVVRYEDLVNNPYKTVHDLLLVAKEKFPEAWDKKKLLNKIKNHVYNKNSINYNPNDKVKVCTDYAILFKDKVGMLAEDFGYSCPKYLL